MKAEDDARRVAEATRKAEEEARQEKLRKAEEARRRAEELTPRECRAGSAGRSPTRTRQMRCNRSIRARRPTLRQPDDINGGVRKILWAFPNR